MSTPTIYIVDDDPQVRGSLAVLASLRGLACRGFASAEEFLGAHQPSWTGCLLLDLRLPGMPGLALQERLKALGCRLPVIIITAHADVRTAVEAMTNGAFTVLEKPHSADTLFNIVGQALQWDAQRRETERLAAGGNGSLQAAQLAQLLELCEQEQQWLACELHDGLAQEIQGALMYFQASEHLSGVNPDKARQAYEAGLRHLRRGVAETRSVIRRLQPAILEDHGLIAALAQLIAEKQSTADIEIEFSHEGQFEGLPRSVQHAAFRMVQEALTNACRYSQSPRIRVALIQHADRLHIQVTDWGVGFDPQAVRPQSFGLKSIRRRVAALGGHAEIHSAPGQGTEVTARLPLVGADRGSRGLAPGG